MKSSRLRTGMGVLQSTPALASFVLRIFIPLLHAGILREVGVCGRVS